MHKIKVVNIFDSYLYSQYRFLDQLINNLENIEVIITSPLIIKNNFFRVKYQFLTSPYQFFNPTNEKEVPKIAEFIAKASFSLGLFQKFLERKLPSFSPDVVHIHFGNIAVKYLPLLKRLRLPVVVSFLGYDYEMVPGLSSKGKEFYKELFEYGCAFTVGGPSGKEKLMALGCPEEKIRIISLGVNPEDIAFAPKSKPENDFRLLQIGTITPKKGHLITLQAFKLLKEKYPGISLTIVGEPADSQLVEAMEEYLVSNGITGVKFDFSIKPYEQLPGIFKEHDIFLHPSVTPPSGDRETAPVIIMDAMLAGLPVVSTNHADIPVIVKSGKTGLMANEGDVKGLADAIEAYFKMEPSEFAQFQQNARKYIENHFSAKFSGQQLSQLYREIVEKS